MSDFDIIINSLRKELPPVFSRQEAARKLGGIFTARTLANMDYIGNGPGGVRCGKYVSYERERFLEWLRAHLEAKEARYGKREL